MKIVSARHCAADVRLIEKAYAFAAYWHRDQKRQSGDPYVTHPVAVAETVTALGYDAHTVRAALLHDVLEDTDCTEEQLRREFGAEPVDLVLEVTKLDSAPTAEVDDRALTIKLADRLHNMQTLRFIASDKQKRKSWETLEIFAPRAAELGLTDMKTELVRLAVARLGMNRALAVAAALLPGETRTRWLEEWTGELNALPTRRARIRFSLQVLAGIPRLTLVLRRGRP